MENNKVIRFYRSDRAFGFLSNLYKRSIIFEGRTFPTSEHAYQFAKIRESEVAEWIMLAPKPHLVALICHSLLVGDIKEGWNDTKVERMKNVLLAKFTQHKDLKQKLLDTGNKILIEDSKTDAFWGVGKKGKGKNMLGKLLMEVRSELLLRQTFPYFEENPYSYLPTLQCYNCKASFQVSEKKYYELWLDEIEGLILCSKRCLNEVIKKKGLIVFDRLGEKYIIENEGKKEVEL